MSEVRKARLGSHALWQLRDYLLDKGLATALIITLMVLIDWLAYRAMTEPPGASTPPAQRARMIQDAAAMSEQFLKMRFSELVSMLALLGSLFATNGVIADDRKHGYYRFLFSKPATAAAFYGWKFLMHGVGFLLVSLLFLLAYAIAFRPVFSVEFLQAMALLFVALGGVGFLLSALWRWDWLSLITVYIAAQLAWSQLAEHPRWGWVPYLLPPVHELPAVYQAVAAGTALPAGNVAWLTGYGLVCFVLGLMVLRVRALATE